MNDERVREILRELGEEPVPGDSLARVRARVDERIAGRMRWRWWWIPAVAAVAVVMVFVLWPPRVAVPPAAPAPTIAELPKPPVVEPKLVAEPAPRPVAVHRRARVFDGPVIRVETADPDVVLIFVTEGGGE